jgi:hypothetical protein
MDAKKWARDLKQAEAEKLAKTAFVTICSECKDILSIRYDVGSCGLSHGYCKRCSDEVLAKIEGGKK